MKNLLLKKAVLSYFLTLITVLSLSFISHVAKAQKSNCGCDVTLPIMPDGGIYFTNGKNGINVLPGQKVCITAGSYPYVSINGLVGTASQPITLINCGGQVIAGNQGSPYAYNFINSRYFRFTGTGDASSFYGFKADGNNNGTPAGVSVRDSGTDYEVDHIECVRVSIGMLAKINPADCSPGTWNNAWTIKNISFHDNYIHNTQGEGFYLGHTSPTEDIKDCSGNTITVEPIKINGIQVYNNITDSTGWDGIQVAASTNALIYNNVVKNYGIFNAESQQAGMILGGKSSGSIYNNSIITGTGAGLQVFGIGTIKIYNNIIANAGFDASGERQDALVADDRPSPNNEYTGLQVYVINNTIVNPGRDCIHLYNSFGTMGTDNRVYNNLLVQPNATSKYDDYYVNWTPTLTVSSANNVRRAITTQAGFVSASANNYHLLSNSPAIDSGQNVSKEGIVDDLDGLSRPQGVAYDAGAYEYKSGVTNKVPTANAGTDITITLPTNSTTLTGTGTDADGTISSYLWTKISGPSSGIIVSPNSATTTLNSLVQGIYKYSLTVTDNNGATGKDTVQVTVNAAANKAPTANAGNDITITLPANSTTLNGAGTDADGTISSYLWTKISGPASWTIVNSAAAITALNNLVQGTYKFELTVTDNNGAIGKDTVIVTVGAAVINKLPTANAGTDITITLPTNSTTLTGIGTDVDGTISSYLWTKISGPSSGTIASPTNATTKLNSLAQGTYKYSLTVTDNSGATGKDTVQVTVNAAANKAPTANAGTDITITLPTNSTTLTGSGTDADGIISSYLWTKISGPSSGTIASPTNATTKLNSLAQGTYKYSLTVTDNSGATGKDTVQVTVNAAANKAPTANAGTDITITLPTNSTTLTGTGTDADGTISSYLWTKISGPSSGIIASPTNATTKLNSLAQGTYKYSLTVTDNSGATGKDTVQVTVNAAANKAPTANAGTDITITLPTNSTTLTGSGTDADGIISSYLWTKISGPSSGIIASPTNATTKLNSLVQGTYKYSLTVTDNSGATGKDTVQVNVKAAIKQGPTANAGIDTTIARPANIANLNGSATDLSGTIISYKWTKISGPIWYSIANSNAAQTTVSNLRKGTYKFKLTVTDNNGAVDFDTVQVTIDANNKKQSISANAGNDINLIYPLSHTILDGSGSSNSGNIISYHWRKVNGPFLYKISDRNVAQTTVSYLLKGVYNFELTVTDNIGKIGTDTVQVTVSNSAKDFSDESNQINLTLEKNIIKEKNEVKAFPNPLRNNLILDISNKNYDDQLLISIVNLKGVEVYKQMVSGIKDKASITQQINISSLQQGMYLVNIRFGYNADQQINARIIKTD